MYIFQDLFCLLAIYVDVGHVHDAFVPYGHVRHVDVVVHADESYQIQHELNCGMIKHPLQ